MKDKNIQKKYWGSISDEYINAVITPFFNRITEITFYKALNNLFASKKEKSSTHSDNKFQRILDNGCGKGYFLPYLYLNKNGYSDSNRNVVGIDFSQAMIDFAKNYCIEKNIPVKIIMADNNSLPFPNDFFDEIFTINSFLAVERLERLSAFREVYRVLAKNGVLIGLFPSNENHIEQAYEIKERNISEDIDETSALHMVYDELVSRRFDPIGGFIDIINADIRIKLYSKFELEDILSSLGFHTITIKKFYYPKQIVKKLRLTARNDEIYDWLLMAEKS